MVLHYLHHVCFLLCELISLGALSETRPHYLLRWLMERSSNFPFPHMSVTLNFLPLCKEKEIFPPD